MGFGLVYSITCNETGEVYVGSTASDLNKRMIEHRSNCKRFDDGKSKTGCSAFNIVRRDNYKVTALEHMEYEGLNELHQRERHYISELGAINTMRRPNISKEEKKQNYKEWSQTESAKQSKSQRDKKYRNGPKREELLEKKRERSKANYDPEKSKAYREGEKREELLEKKRAQHQKNKENGKCDSIQCECGGTYTFVSKARHFKTKKHLDFINSQ